MTTRDGTSLSATTAPFEGAATPLCIDVAGTVASRPGLPRQHPLAALVTTSGGVLQPIAVGGDDVRALVDTLMDAIAASTEGHLTGGHRPTPIMTPHVTTDADLDAVGL